MQPGTGSSYKPFEADRRTVCGRDLVEKALGKGTGALSSLVCPVQPCSLPAALLAAFCACLLLVLVVAAG